MTSQLSFRQQGRAIASSSGIVIGRVQKLLRGRLPIPELNVEFAQVEGEVMRLLAAVEAAIVEMDVEREHLEKAGATDPMMILDAHRMLLNDPELIGRTVVWIREQCINAEWALRQQMDAIKAVFDSIEDGYLRERKADVEQAGVRILRHLMGSRVHPEVVDGEGPVILAAEDFSAADVVGLWRKGIAGIVTEQGGVDAHNIIVARGIGMPALVGAAGILGAVEDGDTLILDAERGIWILNPEAAEQARYRKFSKAISVFYDDLLTYADKPSVSADGHPMQLMANMEFLEEIELAHRVGANGVGLYRTEFLFMNEPQIPTEERQYEHYVQIVRGMGGQTVTLRLLDIGGDKPELYGALAGHEYAGDNPAMGLRGVRLLLRWPEALRAQLRALVRAAAEGPVNILIPMVIGLEEVEQVREWTERCMQELGIRSNVAVGAMIEVPAAVMIADDLAKVCDFFSVGTNDLIQYTLAVDRSDEEVSSIYRPTHPAVLEMLRRTARAAKKTGIPVSVCGELAGEPEWTETFLNMGMDSLSMSLNRILKVRRQLSRLNYRPET
ncbi:MAG TPA: phosphoenolpyruvate--protein phosphotransferase [Mariprofundaceae bacterium]|nr:phosphoenolpyruvate--protein phosphotransferase [Mariprofundaceae bacterium]